MRIPAGWSVGCEGCCSPFDLEAPNTPQHDGPPASLEEIDRRGVFDGLIHEYYVRVARQDCASGPDMCHLGVSWSSCETRALDRHYFAVWQ